MLRRQWAGYARYHQDRTNLLLHIVMVPVFMLATVLLVAGVLRLSLTLVVAGVVGLVLALAVEGRGHARETVPAEPFAGPLDFAGRLFFEQWVTFPRFVLSRGWARNFARAEPPTRGSVG
jgi:phage terminase small subunit